MGRFQKYWPAPALMALAAWPGNALAEDAASTIDSGDTAWVLASAALVLLMTPGLALFYGGMARQKNALGTIMHSFFIIALISVQWLVIGYTLAFGPDVGSVIGGLDHLFLAGIGQEPSKFAATIPSLAFMMYQGMFAIITPALISGAYAERIRFGAFAVFSVLWATFVYDPIAHWVWGGGWLAQLAALDFAGGTVVHISSGTAALAAAIVLGKRSGWPGEPMVPHNLPLTVLGAGILWFGWFGFNGGSALSAGGLASSAFVVTHMATAAATLGWAGAEYLHRGKASVLGAASGAVAGLVAITPASGFVNPLASLIIGGVAGVLCYFAVSIKFKFGYDDSLDVVGVHGVGGSWGAIATGLFATTAVNAAGKDGLFYGNPAQLGVQLVATVATIVYAFVVTWILLKVVDATMGLRVPQEDEVVGLDLSQHGERAYNL
jgi:Amt family ammonium transporter